MWYLCDTKCPKIATASPKQAIWVSYGFAKCKSVNVFSSWIKKCWSRCFFLFFLKGESYKAVKILRFISFPFSYASHMLFSFLVFKMQKIKKNVFSIQKHEFSTTCYVYMGIMFYANDNEYFDMNISPLTWHMQKIKKHWNRNLIFMWVSL